MPAKGLRTFDDVTVTAVAGLQVIDRDAEAGCDQSADGAVRVP